jgi:hypothetical protein
MAEDWKEIRVFISSTFHDMQAERDHLVRFRVPARAGEARGGRQHDGGAIDGEILMADRLQDYPFF